MGKRFCGFGVSTCSEFFENLHVIDPLWEGLLTGKFASKLRGWIAAGPMNLWGISSLSIGLEDTVGIACILSEPWLLTWSRSLATRVSPCRQLVHDMTITTQHYKNKQHSIQPGQQIIKASCVSGQTADHLAALRSPCESYHVSSRCETSTGLRVNVSHTCLQGHAKSRCLCHLRHDWLRLGKETSCISCLQNASAANRILTTAK